MGEYREEKPDLQQQYARHAYDKPRPKTDWQPEPDSASVHHTQHVPIPSPSTTRADVLDTAKEYVTKSRQDTHGKPEDTFQRIADLWNAYLQPAGDHGGDRVLSATDVSMLLALLKIARQAGNPGNKDNYVDLAGYAACAAELEQL